MRKVLKWILLVWTILAIPSTVVLADDLEVVFFALVYQGLIIGLMVSDIKKEK